MSAFLCSDQMISDLAYHLTLRMARNGESRCEELLARDMHDLNVDALGQRYGDRREDFAPFVYQEPRIIMTDVALHKGLRCWLYQCAEGDVPERDLYKELERLSDDLALDIVHSLPEYDTAAWDW
jgi:hypothetical protein